MFWSAAALLSSLNALEALMSSMTSVSSDSNVVCIVCIAASLPNFLSSTQLEWATGPNNNLLRNTHYPLSTNSPLNFPNSYWSNSTFAFIHWNQTVSYQGLYGRRINVLCTQSPCHCGYCLTRPWIVDDCFKDLQARIAMIIIIIIIIIIIYFFNF